jgi:hypothetical protein
MMGGILSGVGKALQGMKLPGGLMQRITSGQINPDPRAQFNAVLLATVAHINEKPNFNFELEMNDLWTRLGNLRQEQGAAQQRQISSGLSTLANLSPQLGQLVEQMLKSPGFSGR